MNVRVFGTYRYVWLLLSIVVITVIYYYSGQTNNESLEFSNKIADAFKIETEFDWEMPSWKHLAFGLSLRKWAHVVAYIGLGITLYGWIRYATVCIGIGFVLGILDEFHQYFVPGRTPTLKDIVIDTIGICIAIIFWKVLIRTTKTKVGKRFMIWCCRYKTTAFIVHLIDLNESDID